MSNRVIRDLQDTSSYWAAIWTICPMKDVHVICDAPIGCYNLVAQAVTDYTDAVPHIENITPSVITEQEVSSSGTAEAVKRTYEGLRDEGMLDGKKLILVSTAESEMIGSDLSNLTSQLAPGTTFFHSESLTEDEWVGRDRVMQWLWDNYGAAESEQLEVEPGLVNIIGPTYACFNNIADLHEIKRLIEGAGGQVNVVFPWECDLADIANLKRGQVNVVMYKEFGHTLADTLGQPWIYAPMGIENTVTFVKQLGEMLGKTEQAEAFIRQEKQTTLQAVWDLWKGVQSDWFGTLTIGIVAGQSYAEGLQAFLGDEMGMPISFATSRPRRPGDLDNFAVRQMLHDSPPSFVFGSINEKIYLSEGGARMTNFIPAAFPGPVVRRAVGTPFMGFRGTVYLLQEICNRLYEALFNFLPLDSAYSGQNSSNGAANDPGNLPWNDDAKQMLDKAVEKQPFLARISASREMQMRVESEARARGLATVDAAIASEVLRV